ncbi:MAG: hypothetical protein M3Y07_10920, partial [Acidobacteriota bacterium]|nr:hypothetical protein [Acidobacteriota bacterium]
MQLLQDRLGARSLPVLVKDEMKHWASTVNGKMRMPKCSSIAATCGGDLWLRPKKPPTRADSWNPDRRVPRGSFPSHGNIGITDSRPATRGPR